MSATATATSLLDGLEIHHDSEVVVIEGPTGDDDAQLYDVVLDDEHFVGSRLNRSDADHVAADVERAIKRAQLVRGVRELANFIEAHPDLELPKGVSASSYWFGDREIAKLAQFAEQLGEYHATIASDEDVDIRRTFTGGVYIGARAHGGGVPTIVDGKVVYELPDLPGCNLAAQDTGS